MMRDQASVLVVSDLPRALGFWRDLLGFAVSFEWGEPATYVCLCRDAVNLHLISTAQSTQQPGQGGLCIFVTDVDGLHAELTARGTQAPAPRDYPYGMRDFTMMDPDGNRVTFGMSVASQ